MEQRKGEIHATLLYLSGSPRQIGRTHGAAARAAGALECVKFFGDFLDHAFRFQVRGSAARLSRNFFRRLVGEEIEKSFIDKIPRRYRESLEGFSEGSGLPLQQLLRAYVMPDVYAYLLGRRFLWFRTPPMEPIVVGCTSGVGFSDPKAREGLIHLRNLDYPSGSEWASFPTIAEYAPDDGQRYVSVTSLGVETAGITAMNEAGLTLSLHMNYSRCVSTGGLPVVAMGHEVIRQATTLDAAIRILGSFPKGGGWSVVLTSFKERNAVVAEFDSKRFSLRGLDRNFLAATNHFLDPELQTHEYWITPGRKLDSEARLRRLTELLSSGNPPLNSSRAAKILADSRDPFLERDRSFGNTISQAHTVSSVVLDPAERILYIACGAPPVSKRAFRAYRCFSLSLYSDHAIEGESQGPKMEAREWYAKAYDAYFPKNDLLTAEDCLRQATALESTESLYWFMLALVQMKRQDFHAATRSLEEAQRVPDIHYRTSQCTLFLARLLDLSQKRREAIEIYKTLGRDPLWGPRARRGMRRAFSLRDVQRVVLDFMIGDAIDRS